MGTITPDPYQRVIGKNGKPRNTTANISMSAHCSVSMTTTNFPGMGNNGISKSGSLTTALIRLIISAESDPESFYSTQSITEELGFIRGRELVEGM